MAVLLLIVDYNLIIAASHVSRVNQQREIYLWLTDLLYQEVLFQYLAWLWLITHLPVATNSFLIDWVIIKLNKKEKKKGFHMIIQMHGKKHVCVTAAVGRMYVCLSLVYRSHAIINNIILNTLNDCRKKQACPLFPWLSVTPESRFAFVQTITSLNRSNSSVTTHRCLAYRVGNQDLIYKSDLNHIDGKIRSEWNLRTLCMSQSACLN